MKPISLFPDWLSNLTLQQQAVLMSAVRGQDGDRKYTGFKVIASALRASIMKAAHTGGMIEPGQHVASFMTLATFINPVEWETAVANALEDEGDAAILHYYTHLMHAAHILACKHPDQIFRNRWRSCYLLMVNKLHLYPEPDEVMEARLGDFGREWDT